MKTSALAVAGLVTVGVLASAALLDGANARNTTQKGDRVHAITIENPAVCPATTEVKGQLGHIAANGTADDGADHAADEIRVKVYGTPLSSVPTAPEEPNTVATQTPSTFNWSAAEVPGASCSLTEPYPENGFVVWAKYSPNGDWETGYRVFCGECKAELPAARKAKQIAGGLKKHLIKGVRHPKLPHRSMSTVKVPEKVGDPKEFTATLELVNDSDDYEVFLRVYPYVPGLIPTDPSRVPTDSTDPQRLCKATRIDGTAFWKCTMKCEFLKDKHKDTDAKCGLAVWVREKTGGPWVVHFQTFHAKFNK